MMVMFLLARTVLESLSDAESRQTSPVLLHKVFDGLLVCLCIISECPANSFTDEELGLVCPLQTQAEEEVGIDVFLLTELQQYCS